MSRLKAAAALACAFIALAGSAAEAKNTNKPPRHDSRVACLPIYDNSGRVTCASHVARASGHAKARARAVDANGSPARLITVSTAAGIDITVAPSFASAIQGFIADAVAAGYRPTRISCYSLSHSHVRRSLHKIGEACDFNQHGWNKTDRFMYRVRHLAAKWGLRDGCSFRDCGHIDAGRAVARIHRRGRMASR